MEVPKCLGKQPVPRFQLRRFVFELCGGGFQIGTLLNSMNSLLSIVSKQIWPQLLPVLHFRPKQVILLHTDSASESKDPAGRLADFLKNNHICGKVSLRPIAHDSFQSMVDSLGRVGEEFEIDETKAMVNLTGGNKLMAMAAAEWCRLNGVPCFYLERNMKLFGFGISKFDLVPQVPVKMNGELANGLHPLELLRCQLGEATIVDEGQTLQLNTHGSGMSLEEWRSNKFAKEDYRKFLKIEGANNPARLGDWLEYATAAVALKLGVSVVQRGIRLRPKVLDWRCNEEGELDLVFTWGGKLWLVDCKDRLGAKDRLDNLRFEIKRMGSISTSLMKTIESIETDLGLADMKTFRQDLQQVAEGAGLLGETVCVRSHPLPEGAVDFAKSRRISVIYVKDLVAGLENCLFGDRPATASDLRTLSRKF